MYVYIYIRVYIYIYIYVYMNIYTEYPFIAIAPRSSLAQSGNTW